MGPPDSNRDGCELCCQLSGDAMGRSPGNATGTLLGLYGNSTWIQLVFNFGFNGNGSNGSSGLGIYDISIFDF